MILLCVHIDYVAYHGFFVTLLTLVYAPNKVLQKYMDKLSCSYLSVMFSCHLICTHLGGANHKLLQKLNILSLIENSNWFPSIMKKGEIESASRPSSGFWMSDDKQLGV
jgi:hypothetical protein